MLVLALLTQLAAPQPVEYTSWWSPSEMPRSILDQGGTRKVLTRTTVKPNGSILRCEVEATSGDPKVDLLTCAIIVKRGKFVPASDKAGNAIYGVYRQTVTWAVVPLGEQAESDARGDVELTVSKLPAGIKSPATVGVMFAVGEKGRPSECAVGPNSDPTNEPLAAVACQQLVNGYAPVPATDENGVVRPSVQNAKVRFVLPK